MSTFTKFTLDPNTAGYTPLVDKTETGIGHEFDFETIYDYTEDVQIGANFGWFLPGDLFLHNNDSVASQVIVHGNVNF